MAVTGLQRSRLAPWAGLIMAMAAEIVHHQVLSDMLRYDCGLGGLPAGLSLGAVALLAMAGGAWLSWAAVRGADPRQPQQQTRRFIARLSVMTAALLAIAVAWQTLAMGLVPACAY